MRAGGDADETELPLEDVHAVVPITDFFVDDEGNDPIPRRSVPINEIFADQLIPSPEAVGPVRNPAPITPAVPLNATRPGVEDVRQRSLSQARTLHQRSSGLLFMKVANGLRHRSRADPQSRSTFGDNCGVRLGLSTSQVQFIENCTLDRTGKGSTGGKEEN